MPVIRYPVGRGAYNHRDDVITIQTALSKARAPNYKTFWAGRIDGRASADFVDAITIFQPAQRVVANGRIGKNCPTNVRLEKILPKDAKNLGAKSTGKSSPGKATSQSDQPRYGIHPDDEALFHRTPLGRDRTLDPMVMSDQMRADLLDFRVAVHDEMGVAIGFANAKADTSGTLRVTITYTARLDTGDKQWLRRIARVAVGLSAKSGEPLVMLSAQPERFRHGALSHGPANHCLVTAKVGRAAGAGVHDTAALQAALANIRRPYGGTNFWTGIIDGRTSSALQNAVRDFQVAAGIPPTGAVGPGTPTEKALIAALPQDLKRLRGVKGLPIAYIEGANTAPSVPFSRLPEEMREAVEKLNAAAEARAVPPRRAQPRTGEPLSGHRQGRPRRRRRRPRHRGAPSRARLSHGI